MRNYHDFLERNKKIRKDGNRNKGQTAELVTIQHEFGVATDVSLLLEAFHRLFNEKNRSGDIKNVVNKYKMMVKITCPPFLVYYESVQSTTKSVDVSSPFLTWNIPNDTPPTYKRSRSGRFRYGSLLKM